MWRTTVITAYLNNYLMNGWDKYKALTLKFENSIKV